MEKAQPTLREETNENDLTKINSFTNRDNHKQGHEDQNEDDFKVIESSSLANENEESQEL